MDCGIPFCHQGCPLGNLIPDWNDLVYRDRWRAAIERLHATNNFPEFTGRLCPAPCEGSCVLGINNDPVTIKPSSLDHRAGVRRGLDRAAAADAAHRQARRGRRLGTRRTGRGRAAEPRRPLVTVFEKADRIGGLLRYGIPEFKMEKRILDRRLAIMQAEGVVFRTNADVGRTVPARSLLRDFDAVVLAGGAGQPRDLPIPGRDLDGVHFAMEYLTQQNRLCEGTTSRARA
jgi:glutamate synthase (NADPH) small chain